MDYCYDEQLSDMNALLSEIRDDTIWRNFLERGVNKLNDTNEKEKNSRKNYIMEAHHSIPQDMVIDCRVAKEGQSHRVEFHMIIAGRLFLAKSYVQGEKISDEEIGDELSKFLTHVIHDLLDRYGFKFTMKEIETHDKIVRLTPH